MNEKGIALVTGGCGFIGQHLVRALLHLGKTVRVMDLNAMPEDLNDKVEFISGSILDRDLLHVAMQGTNQVYHLAAIPHLWRSKVADYQKVNVEGTKLVLDAASHCQLDRFVYTSSETVLRGWRQENRIPIDESQPLPEPEELPGPYSRSKLLAELEVGKAIQQGLPGVIVYPTVPIGPGDANLTPPTRMIKDFINGKNPAYLECNLNLIPVQSVAQGHILAAENGKVGERFILGQENFLLSQILDMIEELTGKQMPKRKINISTAVITAKAMEFAARISGKPPAASLEGVRLAGTGFTFNCQKAREQLGLPSRSISQALRETIDWLQSFD